MNIHHMSLYHIKHGSLHHKLEQVMKRVDSSYTQLLVSQLSVSKQKKISYNNVCNNCHNCLIVREIHFTDVVGSYYIAVLDKRMTLITTTHDLQGYEIDLRE